MGKAVQAIRAGNLEAAQEILEHLLTSGQFTAEQKQVATNILAGIKNARNP